MTCDVRPVLLGYIRAGVLGDHDDVPGLEAQLRAFAHREGFSLGPVYVERGSAPGAFDTLMTDAARDESTYGVVVPHLGHVTVVEQLVLTRHEQGARTAIFAAVCAPASRTA